MIVRDFNKLYGSEYVEVYHLKNFYTSDICRHEYDDVENGVNTFDPLSVFEYFKEIGSSVGKDTIVRVDFIAGDEINDDFVKLWLICERVTNFAIYKVNCPCNLAKAFENCYLTADDYKWAFNTFHQQFRELLG